MHSRLASFWWKHTPFVCQAILRNQDVKSKHLNSLPYLCNISPTLIPLQQNYSVDASKNNVDLNNEIKLEDISVDVGNPAIENIDYDGIAEGNAELLSKLKVIILETDSLFQDGANVPSTLSTTDWKYLLNLPSRSQRVKYLNFLFKKEMIKTNEKARREAKRFSNDEKKLAIEERLSSTQHIYYGCKEIHFFIECMIAI
uniref:Mitochondrial ribonuclease P protein 1 homolog n=1 Tax=Cacopsylla melanoneura TaxID=428564 RepID=A0A8D8W564_9HEMI